MKKFVRHGMVLCTILTIFLIVGIEMTSAQQYFFLQGKVVALSKDQLTVKGDKGETMYFAIGRRTVYVPSRLPGVDERVKVTYFLRRGYNVASQVEILLAKK